MNFGVKKMAKLKINELKVTGAELFEDSETFLHDLTNEEVKGAVGGRSIYYPTTVDLTVVYTTTIYPTYPTLPYTIVIL
jgi:hypothetical protein